MKKKLSKTSKPVATKKAKTGRTKVKKSRTSSKPSTSQISFVNLLGSNLKGTYLTLTDENLSASFDLTRKSNFTFYLHETIPSGKEVSRSIRIGPKGLEYRGPLDDKYQMIGWSDLEDIAMDCEALDNWEV